MLIDPHYEAKHSRSVSDGLILDLINHSLDGCEFEYVSRTPDGHEYFTVEPIYFDGKPYRLVWVLFPMSASLGVINCFRRPHGKKYV